MYQNFGLDFRTVHEGIRANYGNQQVSVDKGNYGYIVKDAQGCYTVHDWVVSGKRQPKLMVMRINPRPIPASLITSLDIVAVTPNGVMVIMHNGENAEIILDKRMRHKHTMLDTQASLFQRDVIAQLTANGLY